MFWFKGLKGLFFLLVLVGIACLGNPGTITFREMGIHIVIGVIGYLLARGALGFTRRAFPDTIDPRGPRGE
jgi:hypothetical protein